MVKLRLACIPIIFIQTITTFLLLGFLSQYKHKVQEPQINSTSQETITQTEQAKAESDTIKWTRYVDDKRNFSISLPINTVVSSRWYENDPNKVPAEVISSSGNIPTISMEISESIADPVIPSNFRVAKQSTIFIHDRFKIPAKKYFGNISAQNSTHINYYLHYLSFDRNGETYLVKYLLESAIYEKTPDRQDKIFDQIVESISIKGENVVPESELSNEGGINYYTDYLTAAYTVPVSQGWHIRHSGENADPIIVLTNEPISEIYNLYNRYLNEGKYIRIYFSHSGIIFSTSGGLCYNAGCQEGGVFTASINGVKHTTKVILYGKENRFLIDTQTVNTGGIYIGATYPPTNKSVTELQNILSAIEFN